MRFFLRPLAVLLSVPLAAHAARAEAPQSPASLPGSEWQISDANGGSVTVHFLPQGKVLLDRDGSKWIGTWRAQGAQVTITSARGGADLTFDAAQARGTSSLAGPSAAIGAVRYIGPLDLDKQIYAEEMTYAPCDWINRALALTARGIPADWQANGLSFQMQGFANAKRSEARNRVLVALPAKGKGFGAIKAGYLGFHRMLESCPVTINGKRYGLEGLVRTSRDKEAYAELVYSYFRIAERGADLPEIEIVIYGDWTGKQPYSLLEIGTGPSPFPNHSSSTVAYDFKNGWQPFGVPAR